MKGKPKKLGREKDLTRRFIAGELDEDLIDPVQRFTTRSKYHQQTKTLRTALMRAEEQADLSDLHALPIGQVVQVYSLYCDVEHEGQTWLCVVRKTLAQVLKGDIVVGDEVRFRDLGTVNESGRPEGVIEQVLPRRTVLTRADSFKRLEAHPIVANAEQMLIVASLREPDVKWGLVDRMIVAAQAGRLQPIVCLNKIDLARGSVRSGQAGAAANQSQQDQQWLFAQEALRHYSSLGIRTLQTSVPQAVGLEALREVLRGRTTVLAGHSGVGKSSLIRALEPTLDIRIGAVSGYTGKGRHTTTSARRYALSFGGHVIDTPGVKLFGLWGLSEQNLLEHFPDVSAGTAPPWRQASYQRILQSLTTGQAAAE